MYQQTLSTKYPGLIIILLDQSLSMKDSYAAEQKQTFAARAVNECIYDILVSCSDGETVKDRCFVGVIGYGATTGTIVGGKVSELEGKIKRRETLNNSVLPIWVEPQANGGTPMDEAFNLAGRLIEAWVKENEHRDSFPPVVINITDGEPNNAGRAEEAARKVAALGTADGSTLILNAHISSTGTELKLPADESQLANDYAKFLFRISSKLPASTMAAAQNAGFEPRPGAAGFVMNASADTLTKLIQFGSSHAR